MFKNISRWLLSVFEKENDYNFFSVEKNPPFFSPKFVLTRISVVLPKEKTLMQICILWKFNSYMKIRNEISFVLGFESLPTEPK